jgi:ribonuclease R
MKFLAGREYQPLKEGQLARQLGVEDSEFGSFRDAVKRLRDAGRVVIGAQNALTLPPMGSSVVGSYRSNPKGFGFVVPDDPNSHGDLFIPPEGTGGAMNGDTVVARVAAAGRRGGEMVYRGEIIKILRRSESKFVGTLQQTDAGWFVMPDGKALVTPIVVRDIGAAGPKAGDKVVVEIVQYPSAGNLPVGVIVERLGVSGSTQIETLAVIRAHGLADEFTQAALDDARAAIARFEAGDGEAFKGRQDLSGQTVVTIDPPDARDFDDAVSLQANRDGTVTLGVHIADVSYFVVEGGALDADAVKRATSVYFPRRVVPMLPEVLSNGVCSLQEGVRRLCKSAFITYDADARCVRTRLAETVIRSSKRLTYTRAQAICDGADGGCDAKVVRLVRDLAALAKRIEARRRKAGMLHLALPQVELVFDEQDRVVDAVPEDQSYTHTVIEMFMVEANEAVARALEARKRAFLRRIHPAPDRAGGARASTFIHAFGYKIPADLNRSDVQALLESVRGKPEEYAVNLAILRSFQEAEYSSRQVGHYALASDCYCHFTSPIRRYPDLTVHRLVAELCRGTLDRRPPEDLSELTRLGSDCSAASRRAEAAEREVREVLVLQMLEKKVGEDFEGVITGVANFGMFVQSPRYLVEGLVSLQDLGDDWWEVDAKRGQVRGEQTGRKYRIGDRMKVRIAFVDLARRRLNLAPVRDLEHVAGLPRRVRKPKPGKDSGGAKGGGAPKGGGRTNHRAGGPKGGGGKPNQLGGGAPRGGGAPGAPRPQGPRAGGKPKGPGDGKGKGKKKGRGRR